MFCHETGANFRWHAREFILGPYTSQYFINDLDRFLNEKNLCGIVNAVENRNKMQNYLARLKK